MVARVPFLTDDEVEAALAKLKRVERIEGTESFGPFSVFSINAPYSHDIALTPNSNTDSSITGEIIVADTDISSQQSPEQPYIEIQDEIIEIDSRPGPADLPSTSTTPSDSPDFTEPETTPRPVSSGFNETQGNNTNTSLSEPLFKPTFITVEVRQLIQHYSGSVVPLFSILGSRETPWNTFHLPQTLHCCSELECIGDTPAIRRALMHAILSVSAYHLRNKMEMGSQPKAVQCWERVGVKHRVHSLRLLKASLTKDLSALTNSKI